MNLVSRVCKRALDLLIAVPALLILLPVMMLIALGIIIAMGRPILFTQLRPGLEGRPFRLLKFRTMQADNGSVPAPDAVRLTAFGRWLRRTSLDELPELWNVIRGDMSIVGPRPLLMEYLPLYSAEQGRRHKVRPGLTGWAQVNGRNALDWERRLALDVWYVDHWSLRLDLVILWRTVSKVLSGEGVTQPGEATVEKFRGSSR